MGSVFYKEDRLRESVEHYKIAVALAPQDRCATITPQSLCSMSPLVCIQSFASAAQLHTRFLCRLCSFRQSLLSLANTLGDAYRQEASDNILNGRNVLRVKRLYRHVLTTFLFRLRAP
jgi:hypothetical protein